MATYVHMAGSKNPKRVQKLSDDDKARWKGPKKEESIRIRVTADEKDQFFAAARRAGVGLSSWMLMVAMEKANVGRDASS